MNSKLNLLEKTLFFFDDSYRLKKRCEPMHVLHMIGYCVNLMVLAAIIICFNFGIDGEISKFLKVTFMYSFSFHATIKFVIRRYFKEEEDVGKVDLKKNE